MGIVSRKEGVYKLRRRLQDPEQNLGSLDRPNPPESNREEAFVGGKGPIQGEITSERPEGEHF